MAIANRERARCELDLLRDRVGPYGLRQSLARLPRNEADALDFFCLSSETSQFGEETLTHPAELAAPRTRSPWRARSLSPEGFPSRRSMIDNCATRRFVDFGFEVE